MARGAGLRPTAKAVDEPPDPTVRAPALDPTLGEGALVTAPPYPTQLARGPCP